MTDAPFFSVVTATFGRGEHIRPTIEAALAQSFGDFELIVVGDGCTDETEEVVRSFHSERLRWVSLPLNSGSQSLPNNVGIRLARGKYIAYLGHDDIWAPDHLEAIHAHAAEQQADFVVSGCVYHGPPESDFELVTGLFDDPQASLLHFFPPTSLAHRRDVSERIGGWNDPSVIRAPVDSDFLLRAAHAGLRFVSTGRITAHKFAAGHRYLSYLRSGSEEQKDMLDRLTQGDGVDLDTIVQVSRRQGRFMCSRYPDFAAFAPGELFERNRRNKGISRPALRSLDGRQVIEQQADDRALDWHGLEGQDERRWFRWSGPNPRPKMLIPFTGLQARVAIEVVHARPDGKLAELFVEDEQVQAQVETDADGVVWLVGDIRLSPDDYTVLTLRVPTFRPVDRGINDDARDLGLAVGRVVVKPVS